jgi:ATP-dependent protease ClpP protease subunit
MDKTQKIKNKGLFDALIKGSQESFTSDYGSIKEYYVCEEIGEASDYIEWFHDIRNSRQSDIIKIHINSPGGNLFTTIQFMQALSETDAHIIVSVEGACMSAATLIFLMADEYIITDHSMFLFHNYSAGTMGKGGEMYHDMVHKRKWSENLFKSMYSDFLTETEIKEMIDDKDIWMDAAQVLDRLQKRGKKIQKRIQADKKNKRG